jgi:hypothetical protein
MQGNARMDEGSTGPDKLTDLRMLRETLSPFAERIGEVQTTAIQVQAMQKAQRPGTVSRVIAMRNDVDAIYRDMERALFTLPEKLRTHSRVDDLRKALARLETIIDELNVED